MLEFIVEDKSGNFKQMAVPKSAHVELLMNRVSFADLIFDDDDKALADLNAAGARVRVRFNGDQILNGPVDESFGSGPVGTTTVRVLDDWYQFASLGWPKPSAAVTAQTDEYRRYSDDLETALKTACAELSTRLGLGWSIVPTTGIGDNVRVELRMHPLADKFVPFLDAQKLIWTLEDGVVDVRQGPLFPRTLTIDSGVVGDYKWSRKRPTATRVVVGGSGDGTARTFRQYIDAGRESEWGFIGEVFKDSRMANGITDLSPDADVVLAETAERASVSADLNENSWFRFGTYQIGDRVHIQLPQVEVTDVISKIIIDDSSENGLVVVPTVGVQETSMPDQVRRMIAALARGVRDTEKR